MCNVNVSPGRSVLGVHVIDRATVSVVSPGAGGVAVLPVAVAETAAVSALGLARVPTDPAELSARSALERIEQAINHGMKTAAFSLAKSSPGRRDLRQANESKPRATCRP